MQESPRLQQLMEQLLRKLHQATAYGKLQKQLLWACILLLDDLQDMAPTKSPIQACLMPILPYLLPVCRLCLRGVARICS